jgi:hypothetical protein
MPLVAIGSRFDKEGFPFRASHRLPDHVAHIQHIHAVADQAFHRIGGGVATKSDWADTFFQLVPMPH